MPSDGLPIGGVAQVARAPRCLEVRANAGPNGEILDCLPNGSLVSVSDGPQFDNQAWLELAGLGWTEARFLDSRQRNPAPTPLIPTVQMQTRAQRYFDNLNAGRYAAAYVGCCTPRWRAANSFDKFRSDFVGVSRLTAAPPYIVSAEPGSIGLLIDYSFVSAGSRRDFTLSWAMVPIGNEWLADQTAAPERLPRQLSPAEAAVNDFYDAIHRAQIQRAFSLTSRRYQGANDFDTWSKGYDTTRSARVDELRTADANPNAPVVFVSLTAADFDQSRPGNLVVQRFAGTWRLVFEGGAYRLDFPDVRPQ
jgi:hypothetical protein